MEIGNNLVPCPRCGLDTNVETWFRWDGDRLVADASQQTIHALPNGEPLYTHDCPMGDWVPRTVRDRERAALYAVVDDSIRREWRDERHWWRKRDAPEYARARSVLGPHARLYFETRIRACRATLRALFAVRRLCKGAARSFGG